MKFRIIGLSSLLSAGLLFGAVPAAHAKKTVKASAKADVSVQVHTSGKIKRATAYKSGQKVKAVHVCTPTKRSSTVAELKVRKKARLQKKADITKEITLRKKAHATAKSKVKTKSAETKKSKGKVTAQGRLKVKAEGSVKAKAKLVASAKSKVEAKAKLVASAKSKVEATAKLVASAKANLQLKVSLKADASAKLQLDKDALAKLSAKGGIKINLSLNSSLKASLKKAKAEVAASQKKLKTAEAEETKAKKDVTNAEKKEKAAVAAEEKAEKDEAAAIAAQKKAEEDEAAAVAAQKKVEEDEAAAIAAKEKAEADEAQAQKEADEAKAKLDAENAELKRIEEELKRIEEETQAELKEDKQPGVKEVVIEPPPKEPSENAFGYEKPVWGCFEGEVMFIEKNSQKLPTDYSKYKVESQVYACEWNIPQRSFDSGFPGVEEKFEWFAIKYTGMFNLAEGGEYNFRINSDDGTKLYIDGELVVNNDGVHPPESKSRKINLEAGDHELVLEYFQGPRYHIALQVFVTPPGGTEEIFSVRGE
ncbi:MAG: hypothetical protein JXR91_11445 [Deltaproteobacteria bacterium]|nr:hypothetical protein [Deltaproteobacteria bacterium]